jgi:hypothetical protein
MAIGGKSRAAAQTLSEGARRLYNRGTAWQGGAPFYWKCRGFFVADAIALTTGTLDEIGAKLF